jgi:hypothetical protein
MSPHELESAQDAIKVARSLSKGSTHELTRLENETVKTFSDQNSSDLDVGEIENQIPCLQTSIQNQTNRLADCMSQLGIYKKYERFS